MSEVTVSAARIRGKRKLYLLRTQRIVRFLLNCKKNGLSQEMLGGRSYSELSMPEDFSCFKRSERFRIMCAMWHLLSKHKFSEAARLLVHSLYAAQLPASWVWRVAFHIFRCTDSPEAFRKFNKALDQVRVADENNRILEKILFHMTHLDWETASKCRADKVTPRDKYSNMGVVLSREPEIAHVQRLSRLYEGLSLYAMWLGQLNRLDDRGISEEIHTHADDLAEKALFRLQEVEALISAGHLCDIFVRPLIEILEYFGEPERARAVLVNYHHSLPENPNTIRYLCEWYKRRLHSCDRKSELGASCLSNLSSEALSDPNVSQEDNSGNQPKPNVTPTVPKIQRRLLKYRIKFSKHVLPEPAPVMTVRPGSVIEEKRLLRSSFPHLSTIVACLKHGNFGDALYISFALLDHPSWAIYTEPWRLLKKSIESMGQKSPEVVHAISIRRRSWSKVHFQLPDLPTAAAKVQKLFKTVAPSVISETSGADDLLGSALRIEPLHLSRAEFSDLSDLDTSA